MRISIEIKLVVDEFDFKFILDLNMLTRFTEVCHVILCINEWNFLERNSLYFHDVCV